MRKEDRIPISKEKSGHSSEKKESSYVWIGRGWLVGILVLTIGLFAGSLWFAFGTELFPDTASSTVLEEISIYSSEEQASSNSANNRSNPSSSEIVEDRGLELAREIKEYASQGRVYGVPFPVVTSLSEVNRVWGPHDDYIRGTPYWSFEDKDVGFYTDSIDIYNGSVCAIILGYFKNPNGSLPPRYELMTFDHVRKVFGNNYRLEQMFDNTGTQSSDVYYYHLPPYGVEFWVSEGKIRLLRVGSDRCAIFGTRAEFFHNR